ncbi:MAG: bifunctional diaminohydroxyphosphoribosylaminopyrimidine deaminase/5-amino-6-(5-phosphoribosylamino)uracil reductase RibD, partial [Bacteroidales bacterium]|nr:bifunctional diaminohydroxyphosphoribosylaminopyrimidine deaminase/5-amino-6-(5-phosphoribosylamino)uracil reductase RibD [Bacteroidales bacterium]
TIFVTMEPCNHHGKTPPCTNRIILEKFGRVVYGIKDTNPDVAGNGSEKIIKSGIRVTAGVCKEDIEKLNEVYLKFTSDKLPFVVMKTAMSMDGKTADFEGQSKWITGSLAREYVHDLRHGYAGIMVGVNTILEDNPELSDRSKFTRKSHPVRIICDSKGRTPLNAKIFSPQAETIIATTKYSAINFRRKVENIGGKVMICSEKNGMVDLVDLMKKLGNIGIDSVLLEGGGTLNFSALQAGIVDKVLSFVAPSLIGGKSSWTPVMGEGKKINDKIRLRIGDMTTIGKDILITSYLKK